MNIDKKCENCNKSIIIRIIEKGKNKGKVYEADKNKRFCSTRCLNEWQRNVKWEDRVGRSTADEIRKNTSIRVSGDKNPTHNPEIAKKVSESLKKYLKDNPRNGKNNPFYGKKHTDEYKQWAKESREGIWSYNDEQKKKQEENTPRGEKCHLWNGGISHEEYPKEFSIKLKKKIKIRDNYTCVCGKKTQKLCIHHIDYIKENCDDKNLITLCLSCHGKTNINRKHWTIFFESIIKERYETDILTDY